MMGRMVLWFTLSLAIGWPALSRGSQPTRYSQKTLLKNWAMCRCLAKAYGPGMPAEDAEATASAYLELGKAPIEAYDKLAKLVERYLSVPYSGSVKSNYNTMKCINLYNSKDLERAVARLAR